jgi:AcrR family transcriptional regulator
MYNIFMARRSDHGKEELRDLIYNNAKEIIIVKGLSELTARKLASKISYTPGTIYSFFQNIDDLVMQINAETLDDLYDVLKFGIESETSIKDKISSIAKNYIEFSNINKNLLQTLLEYQYKKQVLIPVWYQSKIDRNFKLIEGCLSGLNISLDDCETFARVLWSSLHGITNLANKGKLNLTKIKSAQELAVSFIENFIIGLENRKP